MMAQEAAYRASNKFGALLRVGHWVHFHEKLEPRQPAGLLDEKMSKFRLHPRAMVSAVCGK